MTENDIGKIVVDCPVNLHKELGPGLLEQTSLFSFLQSALKPILERFSKEIRHLNPCRAGSRLPISCSGGMRCRFPALQWLSDRSGLFATEQWCP